MTTLKRTDLQSALSTLVYRMHEVNRALTGRTVDTGGFGEHCGPDHTPVSFSVKIWNHANGPVNIGFDRCGQGIWRDADAVLFTSAYGWRLWRYTYEPFTAVEVAAGDWDVQAVHGLPRAMNAARVGEMIAEMFAVASEEAQA